MRPLRVALQAFGSYAQRQVIDFRRLEDHRFFLICGPTGAGKSTLFDALCFALYGVSAGGEREAAQLRSDLAPPELPTEVTLDFALGSRRYRVMRRPRQLRPKKRGEGMTEDQPLAELWQRDGLACEDPGDGKLLASQARAVNEAIEKLLGFRADQFRQVVLLPQGRFERLLKADSRDRQQLLDALFDTRHFARIEQALREEAKRARQRAEKLLAQRETLLGEAQVGSPAELRGELERLEPEQASCERQVERSTSIEKRARRSLERARVEHGAARELWSALAELDERRKMGPRIERERQRCRRARRAAPLGELVRAVGERERELQKAAAQLQQAARQRAHARRAVEEAERSWERERQRERQRREARARVEELERMAEQLELLGEAERRATELERGLGDVVERRRSAHEDLRAIDERLAEVERAAQSARRLSEELQPRRVAWEAARAQTQLRGQLERWSEQHDAARRDEQRAEREAEAAAGRWEAAQDRLDEALGGRAGQGGRAEGEREPAPGDIDARGWQELFALSGELRRCGEQLREAEAALRRASSRRAELKARVESLVELLGLAGREQLSSFRERQKRLRRLVREAERGRDELAQLQSQVEKQREQHERAAQRIDELDRQRAEIRDELQRARALWQERGRQVPGELRDAQLLDEALANARRELASGEQALRAAESARADERGALSAAERLASERRAALRAALLRCELGEAELQLRRSEAGFADDDALRDALLDEDELSALEQRIAEHDRAAAVAEQRVQRAREEVIVGPLADLARLEQRADSARRERDEALRRVAETRLRREQTAARLERLDRIARRLERAEGHYGRVGRLADAAGGKNPGRITFQRYVLAALLEDVLIAASERLRRMTRGRFSLQRSLERRGGLDLEITDSLTGTVRSPVTLSGGETFLASLALALGLADVVQAHAGGVHLETIFIDEGFGGLDAEALDQALSALFDLQGSGRRVGIISHVPELRERVDVRLEVSSTPRGSRAELIVP